MSIEQHRHHLILDGDWWTSDWVVFRQGDRAVARVTGYFFGVTGSIAYRPTSFEPLPDTEPPECPECMAVATMWSCEMPPRGHA